MIVEIPKHWFFEGMTTEEVRAEAMKAYQAGAEIRREQDVKWLDALAFALENYQSRPDDDPSPSRLILSKGMRYRRGFVDFEFETHGTLLPADLMALDEEPLPIHCEILK